ncbi:MAG: phospho-N-acetylmuramoyl-pentapeptide-transferase, partial [Deltaproteobacteria bacterium]|nr:phospho-N-acetylmuramoyl-pentapeptide-transferase [Deltaproteobacteria bacterium]
MFYHLLYPLAEYHTIFNVFQYISFRTIYATVTALVISFVVGPYVIKKLKVLQVEEVIREDVPERHSSKAGTPTMGGALIIIVVAISVLLWGNLSNKFVWLLLFVTVGMGVIGFIDDYKKVVLKKSDGLRPLAKISGQVVVALAAGIFLYKTGFDTTVTMPFFKGAHIDLGIFYIVFVVLVITGTSNAVN